MSFSSIATPFQISNEEKVALTDTHACTHTQPAMQAVYLVIGMALKRAAVWLRGLI